MQNLKSLIKRISILVLILILSASLKQLSAQTVSLAFSSGYLGTQGNNTNQADLIKKLSTLGISRVSFLEHLEAVQSL